MQRNPVEKPLRQILEGDQAPPFAQMWARAEIEVERKQKDSLPLGRLLVPGMALAGIVAIVFAVYWTMIAADSASPGAPGMDQPVKAPLNLVKLEQIETWMSVFEGLESDWEIESEAIGVGISVDETNTEIAAASSLLGEGVVYESPTDFLLQMEIPVWKESAERSVL